MSIPIHVRKKLVAAYNPNLWEEETRSRRRPSSKLNLWALSTNESHCRNKHCREMRKKFDINFWPIKAHTQTQRERETGIGKYSTQAHSFLGCVFWLDTYWSWSVFAWYMSLYLWLDSEHHASTQSSINKACLAAMYLFS